MNKTRKENIEKLRLFSRLKYIHYINGGFQGKEGLKFQLPVSTKKAVFLSSINQSIKIKLHLATQTPP